MRFAGHSSVRDVSFIFRFPSRVSLGELPYIFFTISKRYRGTWKRFSNASWRTSQNRRRSYVQSYKKYRSSTMVTEWFSSNDRWNHFSNRIKCGSPSKKTILMVFLSIFHATYSKGDTWRQIMVSSAFAIEHQSIPAFFCALLLLWKASSLEHIVNRYFFAATWDWLNVLHKRVNRRRAAVHIHRRLLMIKARLLYLRPNLLTQLLFSRQFRKIYLHQFFRVPPIRYSLNVRAFRKADHHCWHLGLPSEGYVGGSVLAIRA